MGCNIFIENNGELMLDIWRESIERNVAEYDVFIHQYKIDSSSPMISSQKAKSMKEEGKKMNNKKHN